MHDKDELCVRQVGRARARDTRREGKTPVKASNRTLLRVGVHCWFFQYNQFPLYSVPLILVPY